MAPNLGLDGVDHAVLVGRVFVEDVDVSLARGDEDQLGFGIVGSGVGAGGDGKRLNDFPVVRVHHHEHLRVAAGAEQAAVLAVHRQSGRTSGRSGGPAAI